jgi:hypothetical protein
VSFDCQTPQSLPNRTAKQIVEYIFNHGPDGVQHLVKVGLSPAQTATVPNETFRVRTGRDTTGTTKQATKARADFLAAAFV